MQRDTIFWGYYMRTSTKTGVNLLLLLSTLMGCSEEPRGTLDPQKGRWIKAYAGDVLPVDATGPSVSGLAGVCRAEMEGAVLPGSLRGAESSRDDGVHCIISFMGEAHDVAHFEILAPAKEYKWLRLKNGQISITPVIGGHSRRADLLYICRVSVAGEMIFGKIRKEHEGCLFPHNGREEKLTDYWILDAGA